MHRRSSAVPLVLPWTTASGAAPAALARPPARRDGAGRTVRRSAADAFASVADRPAARPRADSASAPVLATVRFVR